jgi:hypothetical protein
MTDTAYSFDITPTLTAMTPERAEWCAAFVKAQAQLINPPKTEKVTTGKFSYTYASLPDIIDSVRQVLFDNGLAFTQAITSDDARIGCTTTLYHSAGHSETFGPLFMAAGSTPQEAGSAITYARRYQLCAVLGIAADEDDDGAKASKRASSAPNASSAGTGAKAGASGRTGKASGAPAQTSTGDKRGVGAAADSTASPVEDNSDGEQRAGA